MEKDLKTKHGNLSLPAFFPTVGWPGGRGEYDFLFKNLKYFCEKINHYHFLYNFSSFAFGFTIPRRDFNVHYDKFKDGDIRDTLVKHGCISSDIAKKLIILLDIGGNRIFNKIVFDNLPILSITSYQKYLDAYKNFIITGNPDIFVNFDIGPSYTAKDDISRKGVQIWNSIPPRDKHKINRSLLEISINYKNKDDLLMVPINAANPTIFESSLDYLYSNYAKKVDIIGIAGIATSSRSLIKNVLTIFNNYRRKNKWDVLAHGLGLGGWQNIPLLVEYEINTCDVATPWRRACTDRVSSPYFPLFDENLDFTDMPEAFNYSQLYDTVYTRIKCNCPFCKELPLSEIQNRCKKADKKYIKKILHDEDFREMRIRVFFHNVFQHIALLNKVYQYKVKYGKGFMKIFLRDMPKGRTQTKLSKLAL